MSDVAGDTSSEITKDFFFDLKEKEVVEAENRRDNSANGNANEEDGEQEADNEIDKGEKGGRKKVMVRKKIEMKAATGKWAAEGDEDGDVDTKKQKTDEDN
uniref:Prothymosin alpha n=1 Tax=Castor canadensis TaxID=51338 RepID=A0A8C0XW75_CASCN